MARIVPTQTAAARHDRQRQHDRLLTIAGVAAAVVPARRAAAVDPLRALRAE
jgi:hypothetical protein